MEWSPIDTWIVLTGALCAMACALLGNFLVLRQMSMMVDAIAHALLPGLAMAWLITQSRTSLPMFIGAAGVGIFAALLIQWIKQFGNVEPGAAMGIVFTALFAIGLLLIEQAAHRVDLDPNCVLYGAIELTPLDCFEIRIGDTKLKVPRAFAVLGFVFLINTALIILFFKELRLASFDPALATTLGFNAQAMHYLLMTMVAITAVASFEAVGSILVIAMFIVPPATAHLLTDRLKTMIIISLLIALFCAALGHLAALTLPRLFGFEDTSTSGMMAVIAGFVFGLTMLFAPRHGVIAKQRLHQKRLHRNLDA